MIQGSRGSAALRFVSDGWRVGLGSLLALFAGLVVCKAWVSDDAYITIRTIDNFLHGYGLRWNIDERVQSYTHPLWMFCLSAASILTREYFYTTMVVGICVSVATLVLVIRIAPATKVACLAVLLLCFSRAYTDFSTSGLENPLVHFLIAAYCLVLLPDSPPVPRVYWCNLIAALLAVTRMDTVLLVLPSLFVFLLEARRGIRWRIVCLAWMPFVAWEVFSILYYGIPVPNTALAKLHTGFASRDLVGRRAGISSRPRSTTRSR
jgi:arabinofuranosyltransferase